MFVPKISSRTSKEVIEINHNKCKSACWSRAHLIEPERLRNSPASQLGKKHTMVACAKNSLKYQINVSFVVIENLKATLTLSKLRLQNEISVKNAGRAHRLSWWPSNVENYLRELPMFNIWKLSALSTSGNFLIRQVNQVCCSQHTTYWKLYICRFNFTAKRPTRNSSDQDGNSSWRPFTLRDNYLSTTEIPNDLRITKNTFENLICCNIRNIKSNYLKFLRNIYHILLCYHFF